MIASFFAFQQASPRSARYSVRHDSNLPSSDASLSRVRWASIFYQPTLSDLKLVSFFLNSYHGSIGASPKKLQDIVMELEAQLHPLVQAESSVIVDVLYRSEYLFQPEGSSEELTTSTFNAVELAVSSSSTRRSGLSKSKPAIGESQQRPSGGPADSAVVPPPPSKQRSDGRPGGAGLEHSDGKRRNSAERPKQPIPAPAAVKQEDEVVRGVGIAESLG